MTPGDIVESKCGMKIQVTKVYDSFIVGRELGYQIDPRKDKRTDVRICSFENLKQENINQ